MTEQNTESAAAPRKPKNQAKPKAAKKGPRKPAAEKSSKPARKKKPAEPKAPRITKQACVGAALDEIVEATQWQKHTARAWLSRGGGSTQKPGPKVHRDPETGRYRQPVE